MVGNGAFLIPAPQAHITELLHRNCFLRNAAIQQMRACWIHCEQMKPCVWWWKKTKDGHPWMNLGSLAVYTSDIAHRSKYISRMQFPRSYEIRGSVSIRTRLYFSACNTARVVCCRWLLWIVGNTDLPNTPPYTISAYILLACLVVMVLCIHSRPLQNRFGKAWPKPTAVLSRCGLQRNFLGILLKRNTWNK